jgi:serine/threonine protein kinase
MGVVYRASDPLLNRDVAIKLIPPTLLNPETEQRFQREAQLVAQMDHPAVLPIFDFGKHEGSLFFVMPVVEGTNLRWFQRDSSLTLGEVIDTAEISIEALQYIVRRLGPTPTLIVGTYRSSEVDNKNHPLIRMLDTSGDSISQVSQLRHQ